MRPKPHPPEWSVQEPRWAETPGPAGVPLASPDRSRQQMTHSSWTKSSAFVTGCFGTPIVFLGLGFVVALFGGQVYVNLLGFIFLGLTGGVIGRFILAAYEAGRQDEAAGPASASTPPPPQRPRPIPFTWAWGPQNEPPTNREALETFSRVTWARLRHGLTIEGTATVATLEAPTPVEMTLRVEARQGEDEVVVRLTDELGEVFSPTGTWRGSTGPNAGLATMHGVVERLRQERLVHVLRSDGEHALVPADGLPELIEQDPGARVRSWLGTHDRG